MDTYSIVDKAIQSVNESVNAYCKFLSANDSGETGGHQAGILISKKAIAMLFKNTDELSPIEKRNILIRWQDDIETESTFTYYESKGELRITKFGRKFPYLNNEDTGALFVLTEQDSNTYNAFFLNTEYEINSFLETFGLSPTETNKLIEKQISYSKQEQLAIDTFIKGLTVDFPSSMDMSSQARVIETAIYDHEDYIWSNPDKKIIDWTEIEYKLFRALEQYRYEPKISSGFDSMESFIEFANKVLNKRKSRAGKSLEYHIAEIFNRNEILYEAQVVTEGKKKPDFIFPSGAAYHDSTFPVDKLISLASKTTCKDRWRQVINEANRLRNKNKYLLTLQQGISSAQLNEMEQEKVILVVPKPYIASYPKEQQHKIWTVKKFIDYVKEIEAI